jgi:hypothetical protein
VSAQTSGGAQKSEGWFIDRAGRSTASNYKAMMTGGGGETRRTYMAAVVGGRIAGPKPQLEGIRALDHGNATEGLAVGRYEWDTGSTVEEVGFIVHPKYDFTGGSPDGLVSYDGGLEIKCPANRDIHFKTVICGMPPEHNYQCQGLMWVTGRMWWDFVSYSPSSPEGWDYYCQRIPRDNAFIAELEASALLFEEEVLAAILKVEERNAA